ncbi:hypothetical protein Stsp02_41300 [Streptomyces sp. NBRC 14336]|uniref:hypothetical protein n=1 Tax=Streptomyces sp. NBRC 14336 TaxID=3030992 RepID=UPI0024A3168F|nr:hypothetical protein [Streptomyces sp. NBRC 14336]GLW48468.1 hypothetical protein Stsp02_41300 [Streptomyces sp. NBRC 14336]
MLALRLTHRARPAVQLRRLLVASASAGTGFLLLCALGHAMTHPDTPGASALRLTWCAAPLAATVHFAVAVARTDPGTRPRPGLAAIGLGPIRLMAVAATITALSTTLGSMLALLFFLHLRGDLTGMPFDGAATDFLAASEPLPLPAALTLLALVPAAASLAVAFNHRPQTTIRPARHLGRLTTPPTQPARTGPTRPATTSPTRPAGTSPTQPASTPPTQPAGTSPTQPAGSRAAGAARVGAGGPPSGGGTRQAPASDTHPPAQSPQDRPPTPAPTGLPWGIAILAAGLTVEAYTSTAKTGPATLPTGLPTAPTAVLVGWALTAAGLALAGPGLTHLCGRLLQSVRPGALRLLSGRILMAESTRIGRPLGIVCAVASAAYAMAVLHDPAADGRTPGPLTTLGATVVATCAVATLLTAAVEARQARADTTAALLRLGAPAAVLRGAAALRAGALLLVFGPLTLAVAELAALPLAR